MEINRNGKYCNVAVHQALERYQYLSRRDRAFISRVCEGTVERMIEIDYIIDRFSTVPVARMKPVIQNIMRMAVYQMRFMGGVPDGAAVNEAVMLAQSKGFYNLKGFVNGVLRNIARNLDSIVYPDRNTNPNEYLSVVYSTPRWLVKYWTDEYGIDVTEMILKSFFTERPTTVRLKTDRIEKEKILKSLRDQGVTVKRAPYLPYAYNISGYNYLPALEAFINGWIFPQDVSSMLVTEIAGLHQGDYIIDLCAAPGGKSLHAADRMAGYGMVEARDLTAEKIALIKENIKRADLINVKPVMQDALLFDEASVGKADVVFCDLPCSGLGVIGRKPDIKYKVNLQKIEELALLQKQILHNAASYVRPGGTLIYSTCTVSHAENLDNTRWFANTYPFTLESLDPYLPRELKRITTAEGYLQLVPGVHESDGFFLARFRKDREG
ncbi:MAG: 16S rRNA (cytosine(967)-C(5))-methyltransferase RsmB [Lachnospiraceae bacterium]|nr:16S rRNA (cytosine(967)-C(5))-methyltransferase RsmB [Lachnospiraceae bacterium]MCI1726491.1 16S rRNA (cytosine(967)-C(5))-methyltransferase RsmB [Lachnospiraceae bacterium]